MPRDFNEDDPNDPEHYETFERDSYDILAAWIVDKQGNDGDSTWEEIRSVLSNNEVIDADGGVNIEAMDAALDELGLDYEGYDVDSWQRVIDSDSS